MIKLGLNSNKQAESANAALEYEIYSYNEVVHYHAHHFLGAFLTNSDVVFRYYNPNVEAVSVVGCFNNWNPKTNPMNKVHGSGYWELKLKGVQQGASYQYALFDGIDRNYVNDPYSLSVSVNDRVSSMVELRSTYVWNDQIWIQEREQQDLATRPISILSCDFAEIHEPKTYQELAKYLATKAQKLGFTHIEFRNFVEKITDCLTGSVDYQLFVPCLSLGQGDDFKCLVDYLHQQKIGVIFDVPFFEIIEAGPVLESNQEKNRLLSNAIYWLEEYHADGFSFEGFTGLSYNDHGAELLAEFVRTLNESLNSRSRGIFTICKTNSVLPEMSLPTYKGGYGFNMKANFLFNKALFKIFHTLHYEAEDVLATSFNAFAQNHILFGDQQLIGSGPDDLKSLLIMLMTFPGKKLLDEKFIRKASLVLGPAEAENLLAKLNSIYSTNPALYESDFRNTTFEWLDYSSDYFAFLRWSRDYKDVVLVVINTSAKHFPTLTLGVPYQGLYLELLNSQSNLSEVHDYSSEGLYSNKEEANNRPHSLTLDLPAKSALVFASKKL